MGIKDCLAGEPHSFGAKRRLRGTRREINRAPRRHLIEPLTPDQNKAQNRLEMVHSARLPLTCALAEDETSERSEGLWMPLERTSERLFGDLTACKRSEVPIIATGPEQSFRNANLRQPSRRRGQHPPHSLNHRALLGPRSPIFAKDQVNICFLVGDTQNDAVHP